MKRFALLLAALVGASCGDTTETTPSQLNLDRPTDIAFACYGGLRLTNGVLPATADEEIQITAQPISGCEIRSGARDQADQVPLPPGQEKIEGGKLVPSAQFYAFILQPTKGTVALAHWDPKPPTAFAGGDVTVLDADPLTPGKNSISVGEDPVAIATDSAGCKEITANAGSCDLSILDINSAADTNPEVDVQRRDVTANGAKLRARPAAMVIQPNTDQIGFACPATAEGIAYIAYPSCHAVAAVDVSTGAVVSSITFDGVGGAAQVHTDGNLVCEDECSGTIAPTSGPRPIALDLQVDPRSGRRALAIGSENTNVISVVELDPAFKPASITAYPLEDTAGTLGVTAVAISPQIGMGGTGNGGQGVINDGTGPGGQMQFVYAVASDHSVRVTEILTVNKECDTEVDPRLIHDVRNIKQLSCLPVGDAATPRRRPGITTPGIVLPGDNVPTSVAIVRADPIDSDQTQTHPAPNALIGYFAVITSTTGNTFLANVDDDDQDDVAGTVGNPLHASIPQVIAHQLRDGIPHRDLLSTTSGDETTPTICETNGPDPDSSNGNAGGSRITASPARNIPTGFLAAENTNELPYIRQVQCTGGDADLPVSELAFTAPPATRDLAFPDLHGLRADETWSLTYEGSLSLDTANTSIDGPAVRTGTIRVDERGMHLEDPTRPFCDAGVEDYDLVQLRGCDPVNGDLDCPSGYTCYTHPDSQVQGLGSCMLEGEADRLADACKDYLTSLRRYTVGRDPTSGELQLVARAHWLRTTPTDGCHDDNQCKQLADYAAVSALSTEPGQAVQNGTTDTHTYTCRVDPLREARVGYDGQPLRGCVETCTTTSDCVGGYVCEQGTCMEGVEPPQACVNAPERYELRSHDAFTVVGTRSGYIHPIIADAAGKCIVDPNASPFDIGRIPLTAPACDPSTDPRTGKKADGTYDANPCQYSVGEVEDAPQFLAGTCTAASPATMLTTRQTTGILFRNRGMTFTLVDPTYPGDAACHEDRGGGLVNVPLVFTGVQITFRQTAGFSPLLVPISPSYPVKVVRGPTQSAWVMDEGDFLSTSLTLPSTRGKVFRFEAALPSTVNLLE